MERKLITEGKTKKIWSGNEDETVFIESKDDITAGDGAKRDQIEDKGELATTTTVNCFHLLSRCGVPNHFIRQTGARTFEAHKVEMIQHEVVVRRVVTGSYLKREPEVAEGTILDYPVEFFYKDDANHDPLMIFDFDGGDICYHDPKKPVTEESILRREPMGNNALNVAAKQVMVLMMKAYAVWVFKVLEQSWSKRGVTLVDLKIEFGITADGRLIVADVIDNDSWRLWPGGDKIQMVDKEVYRALVESTPEALGKIKENYAWVAEQTGRFLTDLVAD